MFKWLLKLRNGLFCTGMLVTVSSLAQDEVIYGELTVENAPLYFYAFNKTKDATDKVLQLTSPEYRAASDEFTRRDLYKKQAPEIERKLVRAREYPYVVITKTAELPEYDFERGGFSTGISEQLVLNSLDKLQDIESLKHLASENPAAALFGAFIVESSKYEGSYTISFNNNLDAKFLPVPLEQARQLAKPLANSRAATYRIYGEVIRAETSSKKKPVIVVVIKELKISLNSGEYVGHMPVTTILTEEKRTREKQKRAKEKRDQIERSRVAIMQNIGFSIKEYFRRFRRAYRDMQVARSCQVEIQILPTRYETPVKSVVISECGDNAAYQQAIKGAIRRTRHFRLPTDPELSSEFHKIILNIKNLGEDDPQKMQLKLNIIKPPYTPPDAPLAKNTSQ